MANGNFAGGTGTEQDPYLIEDVFDLDAVRNDLSASYKLINDIDLNVSPFNEGEGWIPIGDYSTSTTLEFKGVFDGDDYVIANLFINRASVDYQGLFGRNNTATIKNLGLENVSVIGGNSTGGLVGYDRDSTIINCYSTGSVTGGSDIGGLVGYNDSSTITNSFWDTETSRMTTSGGGTGLTTLEMQNSQTFIDAGWDLEELEDGIKIWVLEDGQYPKLWFENESLQILNQQITPTNIWYKDTDNVNITATITDEDSNQIQYKVLVNNNQVFPDGENYTELQSTPANINVDINKILLTKKQNNLVLDVRNEQGATVEFNYMVNKEDIDTTQVQRDFDFSDEWHIENTENIEIKLDEGLKIKEGKIATSYVRTTDYTQINTTGRSTIESVVVDGSEDKISEADIVEDMNFVNNVGEGKVWEYDLRLDRFIDVNKIEVLL